MAMNKIMRFSIPFIAACLMLGMIYYLVEASRRVVAASSPSTLEGMILVTTLEDELNSDGDCSLREAVTAANTNAPVDACLAGDAVLTDTITFDVAGTITVTSQLSVTASGPLTIDGGEVITVSGGGTTRIWWVETGSVLTLQRLLVANGFTNGSGAGLYNNAGSVYIVQCEFLGNWFNNGKGGGIYSQN
jgi:CSLREA domain-containing protein